MCGERGTWISFWTCMTHMSVQIQAKFLLLALELSFPLWLHLAASFLGTSVLVQSSLAHVSEPVQVSNPLPNNVLFQGRLL